MNNPDKRISWGEPITLNAEQADAVRDILTGASGKDRGVGTKAYTQRKMLLSIFVPPVEACSSNRNLIDNAADYMRGIDGELDISDPDYEEFELRVSGVLQENVEAFESRPSGSEMEMNGDSDCFDCFRCNFSRSTDILF